ncbi:MAG: polysaccharide biosynthesis/export family protein [bacterium]
MQRIKGFTVSTLILLLTAGFLGCSVRPKAKSSAPEQMETPTLLASMQNANIMPEYQLGFGDVIDIKFFRNAQFNEMVTVRPDGRISLAKVGELLVTGMTPSQLDSVITEVYEKFVLEPDVTVIVRQFGGYQVYVLGEVNSPGGYPVQRNMTLLQALASAGGAKISAKLGSVMVLRRGQNQEIKAIKVDLVKSVKAKSQLDITQNNIIVLPQDIVFIPKTFIASVSDFMRQIYAGFLPPLDVYLRAVLYYD